MLEDFYRQVERSGVSVQRADLNRYARELKNAIKVEIAWRLWGEKGRYAAAALSDAEIKKSLSYFGQATALIAKP